MNGLGYHPEPVPGFIPLLVVCFILALYSPFISRRLHPSLSVGGTTTLSLIHI